MNETCHCIHEFYSDAGWMKHPALLSNTILNLDKLLKLLKPLSLMHIMGIYQLVCLKKGLSENLFSRVLGIQ